ncbi:MAG: coproporphyrinogen dehydrogenase HemZ [Clostridia bacterium]|nr:coproporphyrinogen dehydrogenase HemZ [Clostridia bacterium]MBQ6858807.1 coproporphyrinogen dehydrogenase HemZ [Clostridia bacterium]
MKIAIETPFEQFQNDIADVVRLFYGEGAAVAKEEPHDAVLTHIHALEGTKWKESFSLSGMLSHPALSLSGEAVSDGGLEEKRQLKRLIKRCAYLLLKEVTGRRPAWGSLTGIRPTRLYYQQMEQGKTRAEAREALCSLFDLSEEKIGLLDEIITAQEGLIKRPPHACDLYVGIPFCTTRCAYCSFSSGEIGNGRLVEPYLDALFREIDLCSEMAKDMGLDIRVGYIGGGTPSSLSTAQLDRLLVHMHQRFGPLEELTVEAGRPDTLDEEKLSMLRSHPVTRISINPQTMNDRTLQTIGRAHTAAQTVECYELARRLGFDDINMDVIAALPGEDYTMFAYTLERIAELAPDSLTVHTLAIKRSSRLHEQKYRQQEEDVARMVALGRETAHKMGMRAYYLYRQKYMAENLENVGYAKPTSICRYNIDNMEETTSVLALGAGGISKCVMRQEEKILRAPNIANIEQYIQRVDEMVERKREAFAYKAAFLSRMAEKGDGHDHQR